jgi:GTP-binding protein EngB required for normal cell division
MTRRILIVGTTGAGKSSLIKALTKDPNIPTSSQASGCTFACTAYQSQNRKEFIFVDTIGLNEPSTGTVNSKVAFAKMVEFLKASRAGFSLVIYVKNGDRPLDIDKKNYELFRNVVCQGKIPMVIVFTHSLNKDMHVYWNQQHKTWTEQQGLKDIVAGISVNMPDDETIDLMDEAFHVPCRTKRRQQADELFAFIEKYSLNNDCELKLSGGAWYEQVLAIWNMLAYTLKLPKLQVMTDAAKAILEAMVNFGYSQSEIQDMQLPVV